MRTRVLALLSVSLLITSASAITRPSRAGHLARPSIAETPDRLELRHCFAGCPMVLPGPEDPSVLLRRRGYVLLHSSKDKIPRWVAEYVTRQQLAGDASRDRSAFAPDPELPKGARAELSDYRGKRPYDRGHCAPAGNFGSQRLKDESFFLSNMTPQHEELNRKLWKALEERTRTWVQVRGSAYELTGGFFYDPLEDHPRTRDGKVEHDVIGPNQVAVPTHYFKIILAKDPVTKQYESIAFVAENRPYPKPAGKPYDLAPLRVSIDWIEDKAGINVMPQLTKAEERRLEARVAPLWP